jgi:cell division protease FtsH
MKKISIFDQKKTKKKRKKKKSKEPLWKKIGQIVLIGLLIIYALSGIASFTDQPDNEISLSTALERIKNDEVEKIVVVDDRVRLTLKDDETVFAQKEPNVSFSEILTDAGIEPTSVDLQVNNQDLLKVIGNLVGTLGPIILTGFIFWMIYKQAGKAQSSIFSFGKSKARFFKKNGKATFNDVAGLDEAKNEIKEIVDFLKNPKKYQKMGARIPKGVLLVGPSGTGKTLMARAIAGEAKVPFLHMAGSEFMEMLVGIGASRVRDLFENARKAQKAIIFIDELDAIGGVRGMGGFAGSHGEREQTLNQLLVEMDGLEPNETIIILAATNRPDILDPALTRPGRFDRRIVFNLPDLEERTAILKLHSEGKPFAEDVSFKDIARRTVGFSGADLENMLNEAAILAARNNKEKIGPEELDEAAIKVKLGPQKKRMVSEEEKKISAYHEAGHAVVSHFSPEADPVEKISVVARGIALGYTLMPPEKDRVHESKTRLLSRITTLMGGRAAEEMIFDEMTSGAAKDIEHATKIARKMVVEYGMSGLGPLYFGRQMDTTEWGSAYMEPDEVSPQTKANVDEEIKKFVNQSYQNAKDILKKQKKSLDAVADELVTKETLNRQEFEDIIKKATSSQN